MDATLKSFLAELEGLGIKSDDVFVDFIAQTKIYGYEVSGDLAREKLVGVELKKNASIKFKDGALVDRLVAAAARSRIFDLVKVDYIVTDMTRIEDQLAAEAAAIVKRKVARYETLLGIKLIPPVQIYAEKFAMHPPAGLYDAYVAAESESMNSAFSRQKYSVQNARKSRTLYYNGLDGNGFDKVIGGVPHEPPVQFTYFLKLKYEVAPIKAR